jgi:hypothetical protein
VYPLTGCFFEVPHRSVILSEAPRRSIPARTANGAESKDLGDECWQMSFRAFTNYKRNNKVTASDRSGAKWRDLLFIIPGIESEWKRCPPLCHPDRSVAQRRDLQFRGPLLEMFSAPRPISSICCAIG